MRLLIVLVIFIFGSCSLTYNVEHKTIDDLKNPSSSDELLFYKNKNWRATLTKIYMGNQHYFGIIGEYESSEALPMNGSIILQADDRTIELVNLLKPSIQYYPQTQYSFASVWEREEGILKDEDLAFIAQALFLRIQFKPGRPIDIPNEYLGFIKQFYAEYGKS